MVSSKASLGILQPNVTYACLRPMSRTRAIAITGEGKGTPLRAYNWLNSVRTHSLVRIGMPGATEGWAGQGHSRLNHAVGSCQHPPRVYEDSPTEVGAGFLQRDHVWPGVGGSLMTTDDVGLECDTSWGEEQRARSGLGAPSAPRPFHPKPEKPGP